MSRVYKIIAEILANRLKRVADNIILKLQNVFVKGRQSIDSILIANEWLIAGSDLVF